MEQCPERIELELCKLENQTPTDVKEAYFELYHTYLKYRLLFFADEPKDVDDKTLGWETAFTSFESICFKTAIVGVEKSYVQKSKVWGLYLSVNGMSQDIKAYFKKESTCQEVYDKIKNWLIE